MSFGLLICSACKREVHLNPEMLNDLRRSGYSSKEARIHCEDNSDICKDATAIYAARRSEINGRYCGRDLCGMSLPEGR